MMASLFVWLIVPVVVVSGMATCVLLLLSWSGRQRRYRRESLLRWKGRLFL